MRVEPSGELIQQHVGQLIGRRGVQPSDRQPMDVTEPSTATSPTKAGAGRGMAGIRGS